MAFAFIAPTAPTDSRLRNMDGEDVIDALTEEGLASALDASLKTGTPIAAAPALAERFGLAHHTDDSAEFADFLPNDLQVRS